MAWQKFKKGLAGGYARGTPASVTEFVSLRPSGFGFSAAFALRTVGQHTRISIWTDPDERAFGFRFHSDADDDDSYPLCIDGHGNGRMLQAPKLFDKYPWLRPGIGRRFNPKRDDDANLWFIVVPAARTHHQAVEAHS